MESSPTQRRWPPARRRIRIELDRVFYCGDLGHPAMHRSGAINLYVSLSAPLRYRLADGDWQQAHSVLVQPWQAHVSFRRFRVARTQTSNPVCSQATKGKSWTTRPHLALRLVVLSLAKCTWSHRQFLNPTPELRLVSKWRPFTLLRCQRATTVLAGTRLGTLALESLWVVKTWVASATLMDLPSNSR
jgi:hypothetical protein